MRIIAITMFAGFAFAVAGAPVSIKDKTAPKAETAEKQRKAGNKSREIDPIITGETLPGNKGETWEERRHRYLQCPECAADQPFPGE